MTGVRWTLDNEVKWLSRNQNKRTNRVCPRKNTVQQVLNYLLLKLANIALLHYYCGK